MTGPEHDYVIETLENEGFDYAFTGYTDFKDTVEDGKFHDLREEYLEARKRLAVYIGWED